MVHDAERFAGTLTSWNEERGFGFISRAGREKRLFAHISAFDAQSGRPAVGQLVEFGTELASDGRLRATNVRRSSGQSIDRPRTRSRARSGTGSYTVVLAFVALFTVVSFNWSPPAWVGMVYLGSSLACFAAYAADKAAARTGSWRVSETTLILLGVIGGWPGAIFAQQLLRHKTIKPSFRFAFWVSVVVNIFAFLALSWSGER